MARVQPAAAVLLVLCIGTAYADIYLQSRTIPTPSSPPSPDRVVFDALDADAADPAVYIIQFNGSFYGDRGAVIESFLSTSLTTYIPDNAFLLYLTGEQVARARSLPDVHYVARLLPGDKFNSYSIGSRAGNGRSPDQCLMVMHACPSNNVLIDRIRRDHGDARADIQTQPLTESRLDVCWDSRTTPPGRMVAYLAGLPCTIFIAGHARRQILNYYADDLVRWGTSGRPLPGQTPSKGLSALDGSGQVIGLGDTGIDPNHCFFYDHQVPVPYRRHVSSGVPAGSFDTRHRKIVQYVSYADNRDDNDGHGTHVSGTLAGRPWDMDTGAPPRDIDRFVGIARNAKLAFFDIFDRDLSDELLIPKVLDKSYFGWAYAAGARIHSNSWGSPSPTYSIDAYDVDMYAWQNKDFLAVFSAGNNGTRGPYTITSPGNAKNVLCVGASVTAPSMFDDVFCGETAYNRNEAICDAARSPDEHYTDNDMAYFSSIGPASDGRIKPDIVAPGQYIYSARSAPGAGSSCSQDVIDLLEPNAGTSMAAPVVSGSLGKRTLIRQYFTSGYYPTGTQQFASQHAFVPSGALMKAMAIAGGVQLTGYRRTSPSGQPSAYARLTDPVPNNVQGFGRLQLSRVLKFANQTTFDLLIAGSAPGQSPAQADPILSATGESHEYKLCVLGSSLRYPPTITLVWIDYPSSPAAAIALVNDLDLVVHYDIAEGNQTQGRSPPSGAIHPNNLDGPDRVNTVERVVLSGANRHDVVVVKVAARNIVHGPQPYALVMTGQIRSVRRDLPCDFTSATGHEFADDESMLPLRSAAFRQRSPAPAAPASLSATFLDDLWAYRHAIFAVLTTVILMGAYTCAKRLCCPVLIRAVSNPGVAP
ncbi:hypothetical protein PBRA_009476 [Plasmodiophora brassicae]|uniref:subtilisin n=1 Tax=Plasmodiophora brassicae TaxID=37360 RepID=A0A0G4J8H3_PLABS|nr:hypothetical protein PBRA_009476 [Plasmodiophora brassicae]